MLASPLPYQSVLISTDSPRADASLQRNRLVVSAILIGCQRALRPTAWVRVSKVFRRYSLRVIDAAVDAVHERSERNGITAFSISSARS